MQAIVSKRLFIQESTESFLLRIDYHTQPKSHPNPLKVQPHPRLAEPCQNGRYRYYHHDPLHAISFIGSNKMVITCPKGSPALFLFCKFR